MPDNRISRVHQPAFIQNLVIGFTPRGMVADRVCPRIPVQKQSDKYRVWGKDVYQEYDAKRAMGASPNEIKTELSSDQYFADVYALRHPLFDEELNNADADLNLRTTYNQRVAMALAIAREKRVASMFRLAANYDASHVITKAGGSEWNAATPGQGVIDDIESILNVVADDADLAVSDLSICIPEIVFRKTMKHNTAYLERIKYTTKGVTTPELIAEVHGVKEVILTAAKSIAMPQKVVGDITTPAASGLWADDVWVGKIGNASTELSPTFASSFNWVAQTNGQDRAAYEYRDGDAGKKTTWLEVEEAIAEKITAKIAGGLIKNVLA